MKKIYLALASFALLSSCTEVAPPIEFGLSQVTGTTSVAAVETAQKKNVLIEEATGVRCANCPKGAALVESLQAAHATPGAGNIVGVELHSGSLTDPYPNSPNDFVFTKGDQLMNNYFAEQPSKPAASIDRVASNGLFFIDRTDWQNAIESRIGQPSTVNLTLTSTYSASSNTTTLKGHIAFIQPVAKKVSLTIYILESNLISMQEDGINYDTFYVHRNVLRDIVTPVSGFAFLDDKATKEAGRVYDFSVVETLKSTWIPSNCSVVAFIHSAEPGEKEVLQAVQVKLN